MERFRQAYLRACESLSFEPSPALLQMGDTNNAINLSKQSVGVKACEALARALQGDEFFLTVDLGDSFIGDEGCSALAAALKQNVTLERLDLRGSHIRTEGAIALAHLLKNNHHLKSLNMEWNLIGIVDSGVHAFADALRTNQGLTHLDLRNNRIGPDGSVVLAQALSKNLTLHTLDLRWNNLGLSGGQAFAEMLEGNTTLREVHLTGNKIPEDLIQRIEELCARNEQLFERRSIEAQVSHKLAMELTSVKGKYENEVNQKELELRKTRTELQNLDSIYSHKVDHLSTNMVELKAQYAEMEQKWRAEVRRHNETDQLYQEAIEKLTSSQRDADIYVSNAKTELEREKELRMKYDEHVRQERERLDTTKKEFSKEKHDLHMTLQSQKEKIAELEDDKLRLQDEAIRYQAQMEERAKDLEDRLRAEDVRRHKSEERARDQALEQAKLHAAEVSRLRTESEVTINSLQDTLKEVSGKKTQLEEKLHEVSVSLSRETTIRESEATIRQDLQERVRSLERMVEKANAERDQYHNTVQTLAAEVEKVRAAAAAADRDHEVVLSEERKCRQASIKDSQDLQAQIDGLKQDKARLTHLCDKAKYTEEQLLKQIENQTASHDASTKEIHTSHMNDVKTWEQRLRDKDNELAAMRAKVDARNNEVKAMRNEHDRALNGLEQSATEFIKSAVREARRERSKE